MFVRISVFDSCVPVSLCRSSVVVRKWGEGRFIDTFFSCPDSQISCERQPGISKHTCSVATAHSSTRLLKKNLQLLQFLAFLAEAEQPGSLHSLCVSSQSRLQLLEECEAWRGESAQDSALSRSGESLESCSCPLGEMQLHLAHVVQFAQP